MNISEGKYLRRARARLSGLTPMAKAKAAADAGFFEPLPAVVVPFDLAREIAALNASSLCQDSPESGSAKLQGRMPATTPAVDWTACPHAASQQQANSEQPECAHVVGRVGGQDEAAAGTSFEVFDGLASSDRVRAGGGSSTLGCLVGPVEAADFLALKKPPVSNTGGSVTSPIAGLEGVRIDWLSVSFPANRVDEVREYVAHFEGQFTPKIGGMSGGYSQSECTMSSVVLAYTPGRKDALIVFTGGSSNVLNGKWSALVGVCDMLAEVGGRCSRIDIAFDETDHLFEMDDVMDAAKARQFLYFRTRDWHDGDSGRSVYLGKRGKNGGSKYVCIYDKAAEQGLVGAHWNRIEVRFQKAGAHLVWWDFVRRTREKHSAADVRAALCRWISGAVDFREHGENGSAHVERRPRLAWWKKVADRLGEPQRLSLPPKKVHIETFAAWFESSIGPSLAFARILAESFGDDFAQVLSEILDNNVHRVRWTKLDARLSGVTRERLRCAFKVHAA